MASLGEMADKSHPCSAAGVPCATGTGMSIEVDAGCNGKAAPWGSGFPAPEEETRGPVLSHRSPRMKAAADTRDDVIGTLRASARGSNGTSVPAPWDFRRAGRQHTDAKKPPEPVARAASHR